MVSKEDSLSYEQFENKVYQYVGDSTVWAEKMEEDFMQKSMQPLPLSLAPFVSGFHPDHKEFRNSIEAYSDRIERVQEMCGKISVGSCVVGSKPGVGIYVDQTHFSEAQDIMSSSE
jgi:hypothetical protein